MGAIGPRMLCTKFLHSSLLVNKIKKFSSLTFILYVIDVQFETNFANNFIIKGINMKHFTNNSTSAANADNLIVVLVETRNKITLFTAFIAAFTAIRIVIYLSFS